jgi:hypothetical protein
MFGRLRGYFHKNDSDSLWLYQSVYCGACNALADKFGAKGRIVLSYEFTAAAALLLSLDDTSPSETPLRCPLKGIGKRNCVVFDQKWISDLIDLYLCLMHLKASDDLDDERGLKRLPAQMFQKAFKIDNDEIKQKMLEINFDFELAKKLVAERNTNDFEWLDESLEASAQLFGEIGKSVSYISGRQDMKTELTKLGENLGRCVDLIDMLEDLPADLKRNRFNPLAHIYANGSRKPTVIRKNASDDIDYLVKQLSCDLAISLQNLELKRNEQLIKGIYGHSIEFSFFKALGKKKPEYCKMKEAAI